MSAHDALKPVSNGHDWNYLVAWTNTPGSFHIVQIREVSRADGQVLRVQVMRLLGHEMVREFDLELIGRLADQQRMHSNLGTMPQLWQSKRAEFFFGVSAT